MLCAQLGREVVDRTIERDEVRIREELVVLFKQAVISGANRCDATLETHEIRHTKRRVIESLK